MHCGQRECSLIDRWDIVVGAVLTGLGDDPVQLHMSMSYSSVGSGDLTPTAEGSPRLGLDRMEDPGHCIETGRDQ